MLEMHSSGPEQYNFRYRPQSKDATKFRFHVFPHFHPRKHVIYFLWKWTALKGVYEFKMEFDGVFGDRVFRSDLFFSKKSSFVVLIESFPLWLLGYLLHQVTYQKYFMYITVNKDLCNQEYYQQARIVISKHW